MDRVDMEIEKKRNKDLFVTAFKQNKDEWVHSLRNN
jgi:hypothetical protein